MLRDTLPERREARWLLLGVLLNFLGRGLTVPFLFIYLTDVRGLADALAGLAAGWFGVVMLVFAPIGGSLMDRFGARPVAMISLLVQVLGGVLLAFADTPALAFLAIFVSAAGNGPVWPAGSTMLAQLTGERERQRAFALQFALLNIGIGLGGLIAGAVVDVHRPATFQAIYLLDAATYLVPLVILLAMPSIGRRPGEPGQARAATGGYRAMVRDRPFRRLLIFGLTLMTCGYAQLEVGFAAFSVRVAEVGPRVVAWAIAANTLIILVAQIPVMRRLEGRSRSRSLAVVGVVFGVAWLILGAGGLAGGHRPMLAAALVIACMVVFGLGETVLQPMQPALINALAPDDLRGRYNAANTMNMGIATVLAPITAGPLIGAGLGGAWVILIVGGCLIASLLALLLHRHVTAAQDGTATAEVAGSARPTG
ncbi:MFS transporter [Actinoplanes ianthinogenes]|uniref:MFS transporter n=1 Tax=Actinoplanes ianthinogenes TaxID=122358 RepID=A0ABN6CSF5_9ACTN|nr:MFS transporter [Actinoplanes ianthinogenes]BCJ48186.1 MFS transporter [Actinoplanes ianthinogenes]GGR07028.1 MFS transporter [Actinoplanes ianthinogenes]